MINHLESITVRLLCKTPAAGDDKPAYQLRRYHQSPMTPHVIPYQNRMKLSLSRFIKDPVGFQIKFQYFSFTASYSSGAAIIFISAVSIPKAAQVS